MRGRVVEIVKTSRNGGWAKMEMSRIGDRARMDEKVHIKCAK